jgi:hypothetical protein
MAKKTKDFIKETKEYVIFLEKALKSENFKKNEPTKYELYKEKLKKAKLRLKLLDK